MPTMADDAIVKVDSIAPMNEPVPYPFTTDQLYSSLPLRSDPRCIRILDLDAPAKSIGCKRKSRQLTGHLRVVNLHQRPSFTALSYVWGKKASPSHVVTLSSLGCNVEITENCFEALWHIQELFGAVSIWVDSIAINQNDKGKKSARFH
jgi:Heterokaryon incompatibility protein (HET)